MGKTNLTLTGASLRGAGSAAVTREFVYLLPA